MKLYLHLPLQSSQLAILESCLTGHLHVGAIFNVPTDYLLLATTHVPEMWIQHEQSFDKLRTYPAESCLAVDNNEVYLVAP